MGTLWEDPVGGLAGRTVWEDPVGGPAGRTPEQREPRPERPRRKRKWQRRAALPAGRGRRDRGRGAAMGDDMDVIPEREMKVRQGRAGL